MHAPRNRYVGADAGVCSPTSRRADERAGATATRANDRVVVRTHLFSYPPRVETRVVSLLTARSTHPPGKRRRVNGSPPTRKIRKRIFSCVWPVALRTSWAKADWAGPPRFDAALAAE